jgi:hypothetical protein
MTEPYSDNATATVGILRQPTDAEYTAVAAIITANAHNPADELLLLDAVLGPLTTTKSYTGEHTPAHYSAGCRHPDCLRANSIYQRDRIAGRIPKYQEAQ